MSFLSSLLEDKKSPYLYLLCRHCLAPLGFVWVERGMGAWYISILGLTPFPFPFPLFCLQVDFPKEPLGL